MTTLNQLKDITGEDMVDLPPNPPESRISQTKKLIEDKRNFMKQAKEKNLEQRRRDVSPGFSGLGGE